MRDATIPRTPGCQPRAPKTMPASREASKFFASSSSACCRICFSTSCRSRFWASNSRASSSASIRLSVINKRKAFSAVASLPAAFKRGPSRKPISSGITGGVTPATSISFATPGRRDRSIMVEPLFTKTRLSPCRGTMSATVPSATKSSAVFKSKSMRRVFKRAWQSLKVSPTLQR